MLRKTSAEIAWSKDDGIARATAGWKCMEEAVTEEEGKTTRSRVDNMVYGEIMEMPEFDKLVADEAFVKVRDGSNGTNIEHYRPYGCQCACKYDFNGDGVVSQEEVTHFMKSKK